MRFSYLALAIIVMFLSACDATNLNRSIPEKVSQINGWNGFEIKMIPEGGETLCFLIIPEKFGLQNQNQFELLLKIINQYKNMQHDIDCELDIDAAAISHLVDLSVLHGDEAVTRFLVTPAQYANMQLRYELRKGYYDVIIQVLAKADSDFTFMDHDAVEMVTDALCAGLSSDDRLWEINGYAAMLEEKGLLDIPRMLKQKCATD